MLWLKKIILLPENVKNSLPWFCCFNPKLQIVLQQSWLRQTEVNIVQQTWALSSVVNQNRGEYCAADLSTEHPLGNGGLTWLGWLEWGREEDRKLSSMSRTLASSDLEDISFCSISFIFFCIMIVFRVIFSPGRDILRNQGMYCRNINWTWTSTNQKLNPNRGIKNLLKQT